MLVEKEANELIEAVTYVKDHLSVQIQELANQIITAFQNGNQVILMGNQD